jgi:molybdenum cofactor synthesis domain-containing protein
MNNQAELISIGSELLNGRTLNTLGKTLGGALSGIGLELSRDTTIPDDLEIIQDTLEAALERSSVVILSGGLGPTIDDITREAVAGLLAKNIYLDHETVKKMARHDAEQGHITTEAGKRQALIIEGAQILPNAVGAAPGQQIDLPGGKTVFILPGVPAEFISIMEESVLPWLQGRFLEIIPKISRSVKTRGIYESDIVTLLENMEFEPWNIKLGFYPNKDVVEIQLTSEQEFEHELLEAERTLRSLLGRFLHEE